MRSNLLRIGLVGLIALTGRTDAQGETSMRTVRKETTAAASVKDVWAAWTTTKGVTTFFAPNARVESRVGGPYEIYFNGDSEPGTQGSEGCQVMAVQPLKMVSFSWNAPPSFPSLRGQRTLVVVNFREMGEKSTKVELTHMGWGEGEEWDKLHVFFDKAWASVMDNLKKRFDEGPVAWPASSPPKRLQHFVYFIRPVRPDMPEKPTEAESKLVGEHFQYLLRNRNEGKVILAGPTTERPYVGIVVFKAKDAEEAKAFFNGDPAVKGGVFVGEVQPFSLALH
jgi:uncharacterized protein YndB with AHSA1/START domain/uncharacterized protein YciI